MFYTEKKRPYNSVAHIIESHTRGLESADVCISCVRSRSKLAFWLSMWLWNVFGVRRRSPVRIVPSGIAMFENPEVSKAIEARQNRPESKNRSATSNVVILGGKWKE